MLRPTMNWLWFILGGIFIGPFLSGFATMFVDPAYAGMFGFVAGGFAGVLIAHLIGSGSFRPGGVGGIFSGVGGLLIGIAIFLVLIHIVNQVTGVYLAEALVDLKDAGWGSKLLFMYERAPLTLGVWLPAIILIAGLAFGGANNVPLAGAILAGFALLSLLSIKAPAIVRVFSPTWSGISTSVSAAGKQAGLSDTQTPNNEKAIDVRIDICRKWDPYINAESKTVEVEIDIVCFTKDLAGTENRVLRVLRDGQPVISNGKAVLNSGGQAIFKNVFEVQNPGTPTEKLVDPDWKSFKMASQFIKVKLIKGGELVVKGGLPVSITDFRGNSTYYKEGELGIKYHY